MKLYALRSSNLLSDSSRRWDTESFSFSGLTGRHLRRGDVRNLARVPNAIKVTKLLRFSRGTHPEHDVKSKDHVLEAAAHLAGIPSVLPHGGHDWETFIYRSCEPHAYVPHRHNTPGGCTRVATNGWRGGARESAAAAHYIIHIQPRGRRETRSTPSSPITSATTWPTRRFARRGKLSFGASLSSSVPL